MSKLRQETNREAGPAKLSNFDGVTELINANIPDSDQAVVTAWLELGEAVREFWPVWRAYLYRRGAEASQTALEDVQRALAALGEVRAIDELIAMIRRIVRTLGSVLASSPVRGFTRSTSKWMRGSAGGEERTALGVSGPIATRKTRALPSRALRTGRPRGPEVSPRPQQ